MYLNPKDFQHEIAYFDEVEEIIRTRIQNLQEKRITLRQQVVDERKKMWEENPHIIHDFDDVVELSSRDRYVSDAEDRLERNEAELQRAERMLKKPYFGRIDFEGKNKRSRTVYIGLHSLITEEPHRMYVIDWRAPAASMFYAFDLGPAWYETPAQRSDVMLTLKRQYEIENGEFRYAYDTDSSMHDSILGEVLSKNTDSSLRVIIGSIQKEQNEAIRCATKKNCLIYGLAGGGKTSVGLHRLAYILYQNRDTIASENILIISNNNIYSSYVASILPELGEKAVQTIIFSDLLRIDPEEKCRVEDYYTQQEKISAAADHKRAGWLKHKYSLALLRSFRKYFTNFAYQIPEIRYKDTVLFSADILKEKWKDPASMSFKQKYEKIRSLIIKSIDDFFSLNRPRIYQDIIESHEEFLLKDELPLLYQKTVRRCTEHALNEFAALNQLNPRSLLLDALTEYCRTAGIGDEMVEELFDAFGKRKLHYEDALLYMLVQILMGEVPANNDIYHIVIDEAQDYSPVQLYIIRSMFPKSSFTILADIFQTVNAVTTIRNYDVFEEVFGADIVRICLEKCYRSSSDINALAFQLIDSPENPVRRTYSYFERPVKKPQYVVRRDVLSAIEPVLQGLRNYNTAAIITDSVEEAVKVQAYLRRAGSVFCDAQLIRSPEDKIAGRLVIIPILFAKGLEFDAVILLNFVKANAGKADLRRKVYLGCTRALHELYLLEELELPASLADCAAFLELRSGEQ